MFLLAWKLSRLSTQTAVSQRSDFNQRHSMKRELRFPSSSQASVSLNKCTVDLHLASACFLQPFGATLGNLCSRRLSQSQRKGELTFSCFYRQLLCSAVLYFTQWRTTSTGRTAWSVTSLSPTMSSNRLPIRYRSRNGSSSSSPTPLSVCVCTHA
jgi:hypothetical protein